MVRASIGLFIFLMLVLSTYITCLVTSDKTETDLRAEKYRCEALRTEHCLHIEVAYEKMINETH